MFITQEQIDAIAGVRMDPDRGEVPVVGRETLEMAQLMIETWVGKSEAEISDAGDRDILARAMIFQALYVNENRDTVLEQAAVLSLSQNESVINFNPAMFAPFMSPWAIMACKKLSWMGSRSVHTGPMLGGRAVSFDEWWYRA